MATRLTIANGRTLSANIGVMDSYGEGLVFASAFGYTANVKQAERDLKKKNTISFMRYYSTSEAGMYDVSVSKVPNSEYSHIVISKKDKLYKLPNGNEQIKAYLFIDDPTMESDIGIISRGGDVPQQLQDALFDKLYKLSPAPILKEWMEHLIRIFVSNGNLRLLETNSHDSAAHPMFAYVFQIEVNTLISYVSEALRNREILIGDNTETSSLMQNVSGLDSYLNGFSETLATRIQTAFRPRFIPGTDTYSEALNDACDYAAYHGHMNLYPAQKSVCQAVSIALKKKKAAFIIGEMGSGKTALSITTVTTHSNNKRGQTIFVMCPGHIVEKWKSEIERLAPLSDVMIVEDFSDLLKAEKLIKDKSRKRNIWIVISKEAAKFGYEERPAAVWNRSKVSRWNQDAAYTCPHCGKPLFYNTYEGKGKNRRAISHRLRAFDFAKKNAKNAVCLNKVKQWNPEKMAWDLVPCNTKLWAPITRDTEYGNSNDASEWIKTKAGWIEKARIEDIMEKLTNADAVSLDKDETAWLEALTIAMDDNENNIVRAPRKFPIAKYIRRYLKNKIDYFIADEVHLLKGGDTAQGEAFGDIAFASNKTIALTGTLLNGYASGIYYILYRLFAKDMKKEGYDYQSPEGFAREYGVVKTESSFDWDEGEQGNRRGAMKTKLLPGISPLVFTKFLLENAAFISQEDIAAGLPGYKEIPVGIDMSPDLEFAYKEIERSFRTHKNPYQGGMRYMSQMLQTMAVYPDQPFNQPPVVDPTDGSIVCTPMDLSQTRTDSKEEKLVEIIQEKLQKGEKVLVYYHWTNRTNLGNRLTERLESLGIRTTLMTTAVKAKNRDAWIKQKLEEGTQVLICNPTLVETGLDLLEFTTIIYYQIGFNLFTMRQASRRSWRLSQEHDVEVYFLYYKNTVQESTLSLMATKLQASMAIEGKFSEEGLNAMSNNEDLLTQVASSVTEGIKEAVDVQVFEQTSVSNTKASAVHIGQTMAEKMKAPTHVDYRARYLSSKKRGKHLLAPDQAITALQQNPMLLFRMA